MWSINTWLIVINCAVYIIGRAVVRTAPDGTSYLPFYEYGAFTVNAAIRHLQLWRFITFQFLHADITHILFNMFALYIFGSLIEEYLGRRRYLAFYLICGVGGGVMYVILTYFGFFDATLFATLRPLVGASAGIFGVLVAAAVIAPNATILIYGSIPAKLKTFAWVMIGIAVFTIIGQGRNGGGEAAHLGGAVVGFFLIKKPSVLNVFELGYQSRRMRFRR